MVGLASLSKQSVSNSKEVDDVKEKTCEDDIPHEESAIRNEAVVDDAEKKNSDKSYSQQETPVGTEDDSPPALSLSRLGHHTQQTPPGAVHVGGRGRDLVRSELEALEESFNSEAMHETVPSRPSERLPELEASLVQEYTLAQAEPMPTDTGEKKEPRIPPRWRYCLVVTALVIAMALGASFGIIFWRSEEAPVVPASPVVNEGEEVPNSPEERPGGEDSGGDGRGDDSGDDSGEDGPREDGPGGDGPGEDGPGGDGPGGDGPVPGGDRPVPGGDAPPRPTGTFLYDKVIKDFVEEETYHFAVWGVESNCLSNPDIFVFCPENYVKQLAAVNATCERADEEGLRTLRCTPTDSQAILLFACGGEPGMDDRPAVLTMTTEEEDNLCEAADLGDDVHVAFMSTGRICPLGALNDAGHVWEVHSIDSCERGEEVLVSGAQNPEEALLYCYEEVCMGDCTSGSRLPATLNATDANGETCQTFLRKGTDHAETMWEPLNSLLPDHSDLVSRFGMN